jgi:casein kinase I homolog HRR25
LPKSTIGTVYSGVNVVLKEIIVVKLEPVEVDHLQLEHEYQVYKSLKGGMGIPSVHWFGTEGDYNAMVLTLLGPSLKDIFNHSHHIHCETLH